MTAARSGCFFLLMSNKNKNLQGVVYSTDPHFQYKKNETGAEETLPNHQQPLRVRIEKNHRGGKTVTIVDGFTGQEKDLEALGKILKTKCGTGGSVKDGLILIQGEHREHVIKLLREMKYPAK